MDGAKLVVISGGPGAGKTALIEELCREGCTCSSEVARQIIQEQMAAGGDALPWANRERYARQMLERSVAAWQEGLRAGGTIFFDRGLPDTLCYVRLEGLSQELERDALAMSRQHRYLQRVYLAPQWREIYETDAERRQSFEEAVKTCDLMTKTYEECGYQVMLLPLVSVRKRAEILLREIAQFDTTLR